jgi:hypothetical protein
MSKITVTIEVDDQLQHRHIVTHKPITQEQAEELAARAASAACTALAHRPEPASRDAWENLCDTARLAAERAERADLTEVAE